MLIKRYLISLNLLTKTNSSARIAEHLKNLATKKYVDHAFDLGNENREKYF